MNNGRVEVLDGVNGGRLFNSVEAFLFDCDGLFDLSVFF